MIALVWRWDKVAIEEHKGADIRRGIWHVLDALYADCPWYRTPGFTAKACEFLDSLKPSPAVEEIKAEIRGSHAVERAKEEI